MASYQFKVIDRKGNTLCEFEEKAGVDTIKDLMKTIVKKSDKLSKYQKYPILHLFNFRQVKV